MSKYVSSQKSNKFNASAINAISSTNERAISTNLREHDNQTSTKHAFKSPTETAQIQSESLTNIFAFADVLDLCPQTVLSEVLIVKST